MTDRRGRGPRGVPRDGWCWSPPARGSRCCSRPRPGGPWTPPGRCGCWTTTTRRCRPWRWPRSPGRCWPRPTTPARPAATCCWSARAGHGRGGPGRGRPTPCSTTPPATGRPPCCCPRSTTARWSSWSPTGPPAATSRSRPSTRSASPRGGPARPGRHRDPPAGPGGCPWDREQTHASLARHLVEEAYEVLDAIDEGDPEHLREELGDLLLQVVFHAQLAEDAGDFDVDGVARAINEKLVRRHPHVFGDLRVVLGRRGGPQLGGDQARRGGPHRPAGRDPVGPAGPPARGQAAEARAGRPGRRGAGRRPGSASGWTTVAGADGPDQLEEAVGDLLFEVVALARASGVEPEAPCAAWPAASAPASGRAPGELGGTGPGPSLGGARVPRVPSATAVHSVGVRRAPAAGCPPGPRGRRLRPGGAGGRSAAAPGWPAAGVAAPCCWRCWPRLPAAGGGGAGPRLLARGCPWPQPGWPHGCGRRAWGQAAGGLRAGRRRTARTTSTMTSDDQHQHHRPTTRRSAWPAGDVADRPVQVAGRGPAPAPAALPGTRAGRERAARSMTVIRVDPEGRFLQMMRPPGPARPRAPAGSGRRRSGGWPRRCRT
jgi:NTP pyrophosphatase (non-canonical NTP hydrolase)